MYASHLGPGWHPPEDGHRWMSKRATFEIGAPTSPGASLIVSGACPEIRVKDGPAFLTVTVDGHTFPPSRIDTSNLEFEFKYPLPARLEEKKKLQVSLEVDRTITVPPDHRELGLVLRRFEITQ